MAEADERKFTAYQNAVLRSVEVVKYLGRVIARDNCDTPAIRCNLKRARQIWGRLSKIITTKGVTPTVAGMFYQAVAVAILLYSSETRYLTVDRR